MHFICPHHHSRIWYPTISFSSIKLYLRFPLETIIDFSKEFSCIILLFSLLFRRSSLFIGLVHIIGKQDFWSSCASMNLFYVFTKNNLIYRRDDKHDFGSLGRVYIPYKPASQSSRCQFSFVPLSMV